VIKTSDNDQNHFTGTRESQKRAVEKISLQTTARTSCGAVACSRHGKSLVADSRQPCATDDQWRWWRWAKTTSNRGSEDRRNLSARYEGAIVA